MSRIFVAIALALLPATPAAAVEATAIPPELLKALQDAEPGVRVKAIMGISRLGPEAIPVLVAALDDKEEEVSDAAAYALRVIKLEPAPLLAALYPHFKRESAAGRAGVVGALARCGPEAAPHLIPFLKDDSADVRRQAILSLNGILKRMKSKDVAVGAAALPALAKLTKDEEMKVRLTLVQSLPPFGEGAIPILVESLSDDNAKVRAYAAAALTAPGFKLESASVLPPVVKQLKTESETEVKQSLIRALGKLGKPAVLALTESLQDKEPAVQKAAVTALGALAEDAASALPAIKELATTAKHPDLLRTAISALPRFGAEGQVAFLELFKKDDSATRLVCLQVIAGPMGKIPTDAVPLIVAALADKDPKVRALSAYALGKAGPSAKDALPALKKASEDGDERVRELAAKSIKQIGMD